MVHTAVPQARENKSSVLGKIAHIGNLRSDQPCTDRALLPLCAVCIRLGSFMPEIVRLLEENATLWLIYDRLWPGSTRPISALPTTRTTRIRSGRVSIHSSGTRTFFPANRQTDFGQSSLSLPSGAGHQRKVLVVRGTV